MPTEHVFLNSIGFDSYGHRAYCISTPEEHRYDWRVSPPEIPQTVVDRYRSSFAHVSSVLIHELLVVPESLTSAEVACVQLFQVNIGLLMKESYIGLSIRRLEQVPNRDEISSDLLALGRTIVNLSIGPMSYEKDEFPRQSAKDVQGMSTCVPPNGYTSR
jgi:hypothetical protein